MAYLMSVSMTEASVAQTTYSTTQNRSNNQPSRDESSCAIRRYAGTVGMPSGGGLERVAVVEIVLCGNQW